ncbi:sarcosine oxidase subunit gamma [Helcobacillus massiliensis]|uniref:Sarcosine oxidase subunit gamma n=1 Tax=Helcobacillus massiliensis TaxID=521392 RepID=A0A839R2T9_9MICO|nr:sarcosine oxidase subunit gamma family protein [Helcobacillus massiliensis]MBB3023446.1 sarcosine oxidase subunit gamma [Helcobacillus massiliensis]
MAENPTTLHTPEPPAVPLDEHRLTPAAHLAGDMEAATVTGARSVSLRELQFPLQIGLRGEIGSESAQLIEKELGFELPSRVGQVTGDPMGLHVLWLSPDDFLAVDVSTRQQPGDSDRYIDALAGKPGHAVELSANRTVLELVGAAARDVLAKSCHADLHPREFGVNTAITTNLGKVPIYLHRAGEDVWRIYPRQSFADFTVRWLLDGMKEFAQDEVL